MTNKKYTAILAILTAMPAMAQLDNTVEVTNEVKPVVNDVKKVEIKTQPIKTEIKHYTMPYSTQGETLTHFAAEPIGNYHSEEKYKGDKSNYIHLGGGSHGNADGRISCQFDLSDKDALNIDLGLKGFNGSTGEDERQADRKWKSRFYHNQTALKYVHSFSNGMSIYVKGAFDNDVFNYRMTPSLSIINGPSGTLPNIYNINTDKQHNMNGNACIGIDSWQTGNLTFAAQGQWLMFKQDRATCFNKGLGQNQVSVNLDADYAFSVNSSLGIEIIGDHVTYRNNELKNHSCITFLPHYHFKADDLRLKLGVFATSEGNVAPDINISYNLSENDELYAEVKGYEIGNDLSYLASINPYFSLSKPAYFNGKMEIEDEFHQIDAKIGYRFKRDCFGANIYGGYDMSDDHVDIIKMNLNQGERLLPLMDFKKNKRIYFGADLNYAYKDIVKVSGNCLLNIESFRQEHDWEEGSFNSPAFAMDCRADIKLMKDLYLGIDWNLYCFSLPDTPDWTNEQLDRKNTLNIGADLRYTLPIIKTPMTLFVKGDNLLFQEYDRFYGYQNIGANILGGLAISF